MGAAAVGKGGGRRGGVELARDREAARGVAHGGIETVGGEADEEGERRGSYEREEVKGGKEERERRYSGGRRGGEDSIWTVGRYERVAAAGRRRGAGVGVSCLTI